MSCNYYPKLSEKYSNNGNINEVAFHKYQALTSVNENSDFGIVNRKIEFEYIKKKIDSVVDVKIMLTTAFIEGELLNEHEIILTNNETIKFTLQDLISREYVENYIYTTQYPVTSYQTITHPSSIEIVTKQDGTVEHVTKPAKVENVQVTTNDPRTNPIGRSQIFNQARFVLSKKDFNKIKLANLKGFNLFTKHATLQITPSIRQEKELNNYFFVIL